MVFPPKSDPIQTTTGFAFLETAALKATATQAGNRSSGERRHASDISIQNTGHRVVLGAEQRTEKKRVSTRTKKRSELVWMTRIGFIGSDGFIPRGALSSNWLQSPRTVNAFDSQSSSLKAIR